MTPIPLHIYDPFTRKSENFIALLYKALEKGCVSSTTHSFSLPFFPRLFSTTMYGHGVETLLSFPIKRGVWMTPFLLVPGYH